MITPQRWSLVGSVVTPAYPSRKGKSLEVVRPFGILSSAIWSAMFKKSTLPKVEINSPKGTITLVNATLVNIGRYLAPVTTPKGSHTSSQESEDTYELEEYSFTFQSIVVENLAGSTSTTDDVTGNRK